METSYHWQRGPYAFRQPKLTKEDKARYIALRQQIEKEERLEAMAIVTSSLKETLDKLTDEEIVANLTNTLKRAGLGYEAGLIEQLIEDWKEAGA